MDNQRICSVEGCDKKYLCRGYCSMHYERKFRHRKKPGSKVFARHGAGLEFMYKALATEANDCIVWPYGKDKDGYGGVTIKGRSYRVHRHVCRIAHGDPTDERLQACHSCHNPSCINKSHLRWGTAQENADDRVLTNSNLLGERHPNAKFTDRQVRSIRAAWPMTSIPTMAKHYSVSFQTIYRILRRQTWKHL